MPTPCATDPEHGAGSYGGVCNRCWTFLLVSSARVPRLTRYGVLKRDVERCRLRFASVKSVRGGRHTPSTTIGEGRAR